MKPFKLIMCTCTSGHYFVISMTLDGTDTDGDIFKNVTIYDSLKRVPTSKLQTRFRNKSPDIELLKKIQKFLLTYVLFDSVISKQLVEDEEYILKGVSYRPCPQQRNMSDCSLFAIGVLLHVLNGKAINANIFTQEIITKFRKGLYKVLSAERSNDLPDSKSYISRQFLYSFFP